MDFQKEYLDRMQLAAQIGINVRTLDRWHLERRGPPRTLVGTRVFYRSVAVAGWLLDNEQTDIPSRRR